jgi:hypothetical protein
MRREREYTGCDAWRNGFSKDAGDWMAIQLAFAWDLETFLRALVLCARYSKGRKTNTQTVAKVFDQIDREWKEAEAARAKLMAEAFRQIGA